jgi:hypothetical protein
VQLRDDGPPIEVTIEEKLLDAMTAADVALEEALRVYDKLERVAIRRQAEERRVRNFFRHYYL